MKRVISLWFPKLSVERLARPGQGTTPRDWSAKAAATLAWPQGGPRLAAVNAHARAAGLRPGLRLPDARALVPDLVTAAIEPEADRRFLEAIAGWCERYTPWVALDPLGAALAADEVAACAAGGFGGDAGLLLDIAGCAHLFGAGEAGERALLADMVERLARRDLACRAALADTPGAAWALARHAERQADLFCPPGAQRERLASLPVEGLRLEPAVLDTFRRLGLRRIGDLYPLPRAPLARRFGAATLQRLDAALGLVDETIEPRRPAPAFRTRMAFAEPIGRPEDIAAATGRLLAALCRQFEQAGLGARRLEVALHRVDGSTDRTAIGTGRPNRDATLLMKLFEERLAELDPGFGVELMILAAPEVEAWDGAQEALPSAELAPPPARDDATTDLADRLEARLGAGNVVRLHPCESHLPERAWRAAPAARPAAAGLWRRAATFTGARPARLLGRPEPVDVSAPLPDDPPLVFRWRQRAHRVVRAEGPERIADEWWRGRAATGAGSTTDRPPLVRDYYRVEDDDGARFWLFRDGPYTAPSDEPARPAPRWFLHGFCA